jgi:hypothetical protein
MGALVLEGLGGLTGEAVKFVGAGASELMLHFPNTAKKVPQNRMGYPDWAGKCIQLQYPLIPELGPSALAHLSGHPVPGAAHQSGEIRHFCIPYGIPGSIEPCRTSNLAVRCAFTFATRSSPWVATKMSSTQTSSQTVSPSTVPRKSATSTNDATNSRSSKTFLRH